MRLKLVFFVNEMLYILTFIVHSIYNGIKQVNYSKIKVTCVIATIAVCCCLQKNLGEARLADRNQHHQKDCTVRYAKQ